MQFSITTDATPENPAPLDVPVPVRWTDLDAYGHVNNAAMVRLLEEARIAAFWQPAPEQLELGAQQPPAALPISGAGADIATERMRPVVATLLMSGVPIGGCLAALIGIPVIPQFGWRAMFLPALFPVLVGVPLALKWLPDPRPTPRQPDDEQTVKTGVHRVLARPWTAMSILFAGAVAALALAVAAVGLGASLGWALVVVACSPAVIVVGYETVGWRHGSEMMARLGQADAEG